MTSTITQIHISNSDPSLVIPKTSPFWHLSDNHSFIHSPSVYQATVICHSLLDMLGWQQSKHKKWFLTSWSSHSGMKAWHHQTLGCKFVVSAHKQQPASTPSPFPNPTIALDVPSFQSSLQALICPLTSLPQDGWLVPLLWSYNSPTQTLMPSSFCIGEIPISIIHSLICTLHTVFCFLVWTLTENCRVCNPRILYINSMFYIPHYTFCRKDKRLLKHRKRNLTIYSHYLN